MIGIYGDYESMSRAGADLFADISLQAIKERGVFCTALSGGTTPRLAYRMLAQEPLRSMVAWDKVQVFWGDERCVPLGSPMSNEGMARETLLSRVPLKESNIHPIRCAQSPEKSAAEYGTDLTDFFAGEPVFDLVLLGLGENGHTASLFPGSPALHDTDHLTASVFASDVYRVTITARVINHARHVAFLVSGSSKAGILKEIIEGRYEPDRLPAQLIKPVNGELHWLADAESASLLEKTKKAALGGS